jgi:tetratricopeptide (TPR) repeat protein
MSDSAHVTELLRQGIAAAKTGQKEQARRILLQVVELDERNEQAWLWLSGVVESSEDRRVCLENVLAINPGNAHAKSGLRWLEQAAAPPAQAAPAASLGEAEGLDRCPHCGAAIPPSGSTCPQCGRALIIACPACGQYTDVDQRSCPACGQFLGDFHQGTAYYLALAQAYLDRGKREMVQQALAQAEATSADNPDELERVAALYEKAGRLDLAAAAGERAIAAAPANAQAYARLGSIYRRQSMPAEATAMYQKAAELAGKDPAILLELARLYLAGENAAPQALELLKQVIHAQPLNAQAFLLLGDAYLQQMDTRQAAQQYRHACQLASPDSGVGLEARSKLAELQPATEQETAFASGLAAGPRRRPGCVTVYAALLGINGAFGILGAIALAASASSFDSLIEKAGQTVRDPQMLATIVWAAVVVTLVMAATNLAIGVGLWHMKNWARIAVIVTQIIGVLVALAQGAVTMLTLRQLSSLSGGQTATAPLICGVVVGLAIEGYILFWFVANRELFG